MMHLTIFFADGSSNVGFSDKVDDLEDMIQRISPEKVATVTHWEWS